MKTTVLQSTKNTSTPASAPPKYKIALLTWIAIYPLITAILLVFGESLAQLPVPLRTLVLTMVLVPLMVYWAVPLLRRCFARWL
ncbi:MAG: hypothetical protein AAGD05_00020 [Bacteroidota bacterium]